MNTLLNIVSLDSGCRLGRWRQLSSVIVASAVALTLQTRLLAQDDLNVINLYQQTGQNMSGEAVLGVPGDIWNAFGAASINDAQGTATTVTYAATWGWGPGGYAQNVDESPITQNLLTGYQFGGTPATVTIGGLTPNTNYVVIVYMSGNTANSGGTVGSTNNTLVFLTPTNAANNPLTTKSNFIAGQNYVEMDALSDTNGDIGLILGPPVSGPLTLNGYQIQEAPTTPVIYGAPASHKVFVGRSATFASRNAGLPPLSYQWQVNGTTLSDGGGVSGSATPILTYGNVSSGGAVTLITSNANGAATNSSATLTAVTPTPGSYAAAANAQNPTVYWLLDEPTNSTVTYEYINSDDGTISNGVIMGAPDSGVPNATFPGFPTSYTAAEFAVNNVNSTISVPAINLTSNSATITAWVNPSGTQVPSAPILLTRSGTGGAGMIFGPTANNELGFTWNGLSGFDSGVIVPQNTWSFVALVVQPTKATMYVFNPSAYQAAIDTGNFTPETWSGPALIGEDPADATGATNFNGSINDVSVFNGALSAGTLFNLYAAGAAAANVAPQILVQPEPVSVSAGAIAQFNVVAIGSGTLNFQWRSNGVNLVDNGHITGSTTSSLSINNVNANDVASYSVVVTGSASPPATSSSASLTIAPRPLLVNVGVISGNNPGYSGAAVVGQAGDKWNKYNSGTISLSDYSGGPTTITLSDSGASGVSDDTTGGSPVTNYFNLMRSYVYVANAAVLTVNLGGLDINGAYTFVSYDAGDQPGQGGVLGGALSGTTTGNFRSPQSLGDNYLINSNVISDGSGNVTFTVVTNTTTIYAALNGLQLMKQDISGLTPLLFSQPASVTNYTGFSESFSVGRGVSLSAVSYRWLENGSPLSDGGRISGSATPTLTINSLQAGDNNATFTLVATNANGTTTSSNATLSVLDGTYAIYWAAPEPIACPDQTLTQPGVLVYAASFGGQSNGVDYMITLSDGTNIDFTYNVDATVTGGAQTFTGGNVEICTNEPAWSDLLSIFNADTASGDSKTITLQNLTPGIRYSAQLFGLDDRGGTIGLREAYYSDPNVFTDQSTTFKMQDNVYVVGTFLATNSTQNIIEWLPGNGTGGDVGSGNINALVLREAPPRVTIVNNGNHTATITWDQITTEGVTGTGPAHLQSAPSLNGPWTDQGTSGSITVPTSGTQFYRAVLP